MIRISILAAAGLAFAACASVHPGNMAKQSDGVPIDGLVVSAEELSDPGREAFSMISLTFENQTANWLRIDKIEVLMDEPTAKVVSVVLGQDLKDWASAMEARAQMEKHNREMTQIGLAAVGAVAAAAGGASHNQNAALLGLSVLGASEAWMITDAIRYKIARAENTKTYPEDHLYHPFSVPGKMFLRRWLLLNKPVGKRVTSLPIAVTMVDGKREVLTVSLK